MSGSQPEWTFLMTPAQHREWARLLHSKGKPEKARRHEELARVIERIERQQQESTRKSPAKAGLEFG